jgi:hypothetical protein
MITRQSPKEDMMKISMLGQVALSGAASSLSWLTEGTR